MRTCTTRLQCGSWRSRPLWQCIQKPELKLVPVAVMVLPTWAEVGAVSAGVGAATMVSGVDAAVAVRPGFVWERVTPQTTQRWAGVLQ